MNVAHFFFLVLSLLLLYFLLLLLFCCCAVVNVDVMMRHWMSMFCFILFFGLIECQLLGTWLHRQRMPYCGAEKLYF